MGDRELYEYFALQAVDEKGRVAIPGELRGAIERNSEGNRAIVLRRSDDGLGLMACDTEWSKELLKRADQRREKAIDEGRKPARPPRPERVPFDPSGRFIITSFMKESAGITDWALFVGEGYEIQVYAPQVVMTAEGVDEELRQICAHLMKQRKVEL